MPKVKVPGECGHLRKRISNHLPINITVMHWRVCWRGHVYPMMMTSQGGFWYNLFSSGSIVLGYMLCNEVYLKQPMHMKCYILHQWPDSNSKIPSVSLFVRFRFHKGHCIIHGGQLFIVVEKWSFLTASYWLLILGRTPFWATGMLWEELFKQWFKSWNKTAWAAAAWGIWGFERTVFWSNARSVWEICTSADKSKTIHRYFTRKSWHNNQTLLLAILDLFHPAWTFLILSRQRRKFDSYKRFVKDSLFGVKCNWGRMD